MQDLPQICRISSDPPPSADPAFCCVWNPPVDSDHHHIKEEPGLDVVACDPCADNLISGNPIGASC